MTRSLKRALLPVAALSALLAVSGCYAYPVGGYADNGYYAAPSAEVVVPVPIYGGFGGYRGGYREGWGGGYGRGGWGGGNWHRGGWR